MFRRGLNVSLSTDDPLIFHTTQAPLLEVRLLLLNYRSLSFEVLLLIESLRGLS